MIERAMILCKTNVLGINDFPVNLHEVSLPKEDHSETVNLKNLEIKAIRKALQSAKYNQQTAADALGIHRDALSRKMKKYKITLKKNEE